MQPLSTSCPQCKTRFRVMPEQLAARQGLVRCGNCATVFNGFADLKRGEIEKILESTAPSPSITEPPPPLVFHRLSGHIQSPPPDINWIPATAPQLDTQAPSHETKKAAVWNTLRGHIEQPPPDVSWLPVSPPQATNLLESPTSPLASDTVSQDLSDEINAAVEELRTLENDASAQEGFFSDATSDDVDPLLVDKNPDTAPSTTGETEPILLPPGLYEPPRRRQGKAIAMGVVLLLALTGQTIYLLRTEVAARWPAVKPYLAVLCQQLQCTVPLPQEIDELTIESSETQVDPERPNVMLVTALLRNHSNRPQTYPLLEITLTDTLDRPIARRSLTAKEYLDTEPKYEDGIPPNSETVTHAALEAADIKPTGYRLRVYYP